MVVASDPDRRVALADIAGRAPTEELEFEATVSPDSKDYVVNSFGAHFAEVEVDTETGAVRVLRYVAAHDSGRIINPRLTVNQVEGGVSQMLGFTLTEEMLTDAQRVDAERKLSEAQEPDDSRLSGNRGDLRRRRRSRRSLWRQGAGRTAEHRRGASSGQRHLQCHWYRAARPARDAGPCVRRSEAGRAAGNGKVRPFKLVHAQSVSNACELLASGDGRTRLIAGGTDLLGEIKEGVVQPQALVGVDGVPELQEYSVTRHGLSLGALTPLVRIERDQEIARRYPALAQAAASIATPQVRNVGTLGGNLCQRPRCWYYRSPLFDCRKKGGDACFAADAGNKYHAILGGGSCHIVHPSDMAVALISLRAEVKLAGPHAGRTMPLERFFVSPDKNIKAENVLEAGEVVTQVVLPAPSAAHRSVYLKAKERQAYDFALASVALVLDVRDGTVRDARLTLGGVAPVPFRCVAVEEALSGVRVAAVDLTVMGDLAVRDARPLKDNGFKVALAASLVRQSLASLLRLNP